MSERHLDSSGIIALAELTAPSSCALVREALEAIEQLAIGAGRKECGVLLGLGQAEMAAMFGRVIDADDERLAVATLVASALTSGEAQRVRAEVERLARAEGLRALAWRVVEGEHGSWCEQLLLGRGHRPLDQLHPALAALRRAIGQRFGERLVIGSLAQRVVRYRAAAPPRELPRLFADLAGGSLAARVVIAQVDTCRADATSHDAVESWRAFGPGQLLAFDGALASLSANDRALADCLGAARLPATIRQQERACSGAMLDRALELLRERGAAEDIADGLRRMLPAPRHALGDAAARRGHDADRRRFGALGAWEGAAAVAATDGRLLVGAADRLGQRTLRYASSASCRVVLSSEPVSGLIDERDIVIDGQLAPGEMIVADVDSGQLLLPGRATRRDQPATSLRDEPIELASTSGARAARLAMPLDEDALRRFGWTQSSRAALARTVADAAEPIEGLAGRASLALLDIASTGRAAAPRVSELLHQRVTGVVVDPNDDGLGIDLEVVVGAAPALGDAPSTGSTRTQVALAHPVLDQRSMAALWRVFALRGEALRVDATCDARADGRAMRERMHDVIEQAVAAAADGSGLLVLSDARAVSAAEARLPLPMVLLVGALHRSLSVKGLRRNVSVVAECGEVHEGHDVAALVAYGATAVFPFALLREARRDVSAGRAAAAERATARATRALGETLRRAIANAGLTSVVGYRGSARFEALGLDEDVVAYFLSGTPCRLAGRGLDEIWRDTQRRARAQLSDKPTPARAGLLRDRLGLRSGQSRAPQLHWLERQSSTSIMREVLMRDALRAPRGRRRRIDLVAPLDHPHLRGARDLVRIAQLERRSAAVELEVRLPCVAELDRLLCAAVAAGADMITLAGYGGRADEHYLDRVRHAGLPLELALAQAHRWLIDAGVRTSLRLRAEAHARDGEALAALLAFGADEVALIGEVQRWRGRALARELRIVLARLGLRSCHELVGRADLLCVRDDSGAGAGAGAALSRTLEPLLVARPVAGAPLHTRVAGTTARGHTTAADDESTTMADHALGRQLRPTRGTLGAGFAFGARGPALLRHEGFVGDLAAARLAHGARVVITAPQGLRATAPLLLVGDDAGYGATGGELYVAGRAAQRFGARNAGATLVAEVVGMRAFEAMSAGVALVLGAPRRGFAAGISGGRVYAPLAADTSAMLPDWLEARPLDGAGRRELRDLLERFSAATASPRARQLLSRWPESAARFVVIDGEANARVKQAHA